MSEIEVKEEVRCRKCGRLLAKIEGDRLVIKNGRKSVRVYHAVAVSIDCSRCGFTTELPADFRKPRSQIVSQEG